MQGRPFIPIEPDPADEISAVRREERARIARELHDDVAQRLALLQVGIDQLRLYAVPPESDLGPRLAALSAETAGIIAALRAFVHDLHPRQAGQARVDEILRSICDRFSERVQLRIDFVARAVPERVPRQVVDCLSRVLQEALSNVARHSGAQAVTVLVWGSKDRVHLAIRDFGAGLQNQTAGGIGFATMAERVTALNGQLRIVSAPQVMPGTRITATIPIAEMLPSDPLPEIP